MSSLSPNALGRLIKTIVAIFLLLVGTGVWYYAWGRKPSLTLSTKFSEKERAPSAHLIAPGEVLLLLGQKATLYEMASGKQKWTTSLAPAPAAATPTPKAPAAATPPPVEEKTDPFLAKHVEQRFAKLESWAAKLNERRGNLKTQTQIEAFNAEAARYHTELTEARAEAAPLHRAELAAHAAEEAALKAQLAEAGEESFGSWNQKSAIFPADKTLWIVQGSRVIGLDRANGRTTKTIPLAGDFEAAWAGTDCFYVVAEAPTGRQIASIKTADGSAKAAMTASPAALPRYSFQAEGLPLEPNVQPQRTEFVAAGSELVQADIRLIESKITERQVISGNSVSDMEEADKKTTGGWASDAAVIAQAMAKDAARQSTGGKERTDESTYEITLFRPFSVGIAPSPPVRVQGRPEIFSTATLDLIVAGQTAVAYDHANRKLWESKFGQPLVFAEAGGSDEEYASGTHPKVATTGHPCLEDGERFYLFDRAFLAAFERKSGRILWRLPSVGIRKVQLDGKGHLYVLSANGSADSIHTGSDAGAEPVTMKVEAAKGKILWKLEKYQDCFVTGGDLYAARETRNSEDAVNQVFDRSKAPQTRFKLYKLSTRDGQPQWEWFQTRRPLWIDADEKKVGLLFYDELQLLKSIAL